MSAILEQAFGTNDIDLYGDVLKVPKDASMAQLRKAYYKQALQYHPDKNDSNDAKLKFQAISWAYNLLKDPEKRADYDQTGSLPSEDFDEDDFGDGSKPNAWKDYFDIIFGKLSTADIDNFAVKYKMSDEEEKDVLESYVKQKGNLVKMLEFVMLSEENDVKRWMEDYIQPAIHSKKVPDYADAIEKSLKSIERKLNADKKKENRTASEETETEESEDDEPKKKSSKQKKNPPKKARATKSKKKQSDIDLVAAIRNKNRGGQSVLSSIGARYGVEIDDDPLDDKAFETIRSKLGKKK